MQIFEPHHRLIILLNTVLTLNIDLITILKKKHVQVCFTTWQCVSMSRMSGKQRLWRMIWVCAICTSLGYKQYASSLDKDLLIHIHSRIRTFILYVRKIPLHTSNFSTQKYNFLYLYHACCVFRFRITVLSYAGPLVLQWHYQTSFYAMEPNLWNRPLRTSIFETQRNVSSLCVCAFRRNMSKIVNKTER